ncbi:MAG TPA: MFS transporter [Methanothrix sp.]|nr:MFS transporter [Methanothrix sp.]
MRQLSTRPEDAGIYGKAHSQKETEKMGKDGLNTSPAASEPIDSSEPHVAGRNILAFIILLGIFMFVIDGSVVSIALPTITRYFQADVAQSQWVITSYLVTVTSLLLIFGKIAERTGKVRLFLAGFVIFTVASVACGLSTSLDMLIFFRAVQAAGAAMSFSISTAIIFQIYHHGEQGRAMGYIGTTVSLASIAGPMLGGYLVDYMGWKYIFLINLPIGIVLLALAAKYMRIDETRSSKLNLDWLGAAVLIIFIVSLMLFLGDLSGSTGFSIAHSQFLLLALLSLPAFVWIESHQKSPLLDLSIFRIKKFVLPIIAIILFIISSFSVFILGPFYFQGVMGYSPSQVGRVFLIVPAIMVLGSPLGGWIYDRYHFRYNSALGIIIVAISLLFMGSGISRDDLSSIHLSFVIMGLGSMLFQSPINTEIMTALPKEMLGTASSLSSAVRNMGMSLGVSISTLLLSLQLNIAGYHGAVLDAKPELLSLAISNVMIIAAALCILGAAAALLRNRDGG